MAETEISTVQDEVSQLNYSEAPVSVQAEDLQHPDNGDMDARVPFNDWLDWAGERFPDVDLIHFYETKEIRNKAVETSADKKFKVDGDTRFAVANQNMDANHPQSIADNTTQESNYKSKVDQQSVLNGGNAVAIAKEQDKHDKIDNIGGKYEVAAVGDGKNIYGEGFTGSDGFLTEDDMFTRAEDGKLAKWQVSAKILGLDLIPLNYREIAHPDGVTIDGENYRLASQDLTEKQENIRYSVGVQVLDIAKKQFDVKQQWLAEKFSALSDAQRKSIVGKNILDAIDRNVDTNNTKVDRIAKLYELTLDSSFIQVVEGLTIPKGGRAKFYKDLSNGILAQQDLIDDLSDTLSPNILGFGGLEPGDVGYEQTYSALQSALSSQKQLKKLSIATWTMDKQAVKDNALVGSMGEFGVKLGEYIVEDIPEHAVNLLSGVGAGLAEGVVNNTWKLITEVYEATTGNKVENVFQLTPHGDRESALYNVTSVLSEYLIPFFGVRGMMSKAGEITKDLAGLAVAGAWMKPEQGNIIHLINSLEDGELNWLESLDAVPQKGDPIPKKVIAWAIENVEGFVQNVAGLDITPDKDSPAYEELLQRLSAGTQEVVLGGVFWGVVVLNKMGGREAWHAIKAQKKHKTFMDTTTQRLLGIDVFQKRVTRLKTSAKLYTETGMDAAQVFKKTGHIQEPDGNWHFRGDYSKGKWQELDYGSWKLGDLLDDATLYGHIPEAKNVRVVLTKSKVKGQVSASYEADINTIFIHADSLDGRIVKSKIWHEIQHATDTAQGFAAGGHPKDFNDELKAAYQQYNLDLTELETSPQILAIKAKMDKNITLTKKEDAILDEVTNQHKVLKEERNAKLGVKGRPGKKDDPRWYGPEDFSNRNATAGRLYLSLVGERRARHIEATWDLPFDQVRFDAEEVYKGAIYHTPGNEQLAEASYVLGQINAQLKAAGKTPADLPTNEKAVFALLRSNNPHAALLVRKVITDTLIDGYSQAVIKLGNKNYGVSHIVDIHMSPTGRKASQCKGKTCLFEDPRDILSVIDMVRKVKPEKVWNRKTKEFVLEYTIQHEGKDAYKLVIKENKTPLDSNGKPRVIRGGKNKGKTIKGEHTVVTFHPVDGFKDISVRDLLDKITDNRMVRVEKQFSIDDASAIIADVSDKPLSVQSKLLSAQIGSTKDPVIKARIIERVKVINAEIKTNKQTNVKVSILEDLKTVEWNNQVYSKLENFVESLPDSAVFKTSEDIITAAQKYGVTKEEIEASRFFAGIQFTRPGDRMAAVLKKQGGFTKGMLQSQVTFRKDNITYRSWHGDDVKASPTELDLDTQDNGDVIYIVNRDTHDEIEIVRNIDDGNYREIDGYGNPVGEVLDEDEALEFWAGDNLDWLMRNEGQLDEAYIDNLLVKKGDDRFISWGDADGRLNPMSADSQYKYQVRWDKHGMPVDTDEAYSSVGFYETEEDAMMALYREDYLQMMQDDMGNNSLEWNLVYDIDGSTYDTIEEATGAAEQTLFDWYEDSANETGTLWRQYTVGAMRNMDSAKDYRLDTYNIDSFEPRKGDIGSKATRDNSSENWHWGELEGEQPNVTLGSTPDGWADEFDNMNVLAWVRGMEWDGDAWILDELQSDWSQKWAKNNKKVQGFLKEAGIDKYDADSIRDFVVKSRARHKNNTIVERRLTHKLTDYAPGNVEHQAIIEDLFMGSSVKRVSRDSTSNTENFSFERFINDTSVQMSQGLDSALDEFIDNVLIPQGKKLDDFSHLDFRPWLHKKIKDYKTGRTSNTDAWLSGDFEDVPVWMTDIMESGKTSDDFRAMMLGSSTRRLPTAAEAKALHKVMLDDILSTESGRHRDFIGLAQKRKLTSIQFNESQQTRVAGMKDFHLALELDGVIPKPPMGETSSYVRITLLDQLTRAIDDGMKEFGWWDAKVQNQRWEKLTNTNGESVTIDGIAKGYRDYRNFSYIVKSTDKSGNMTQTQWSRQELVEHLNAKQVDELDLALDSGSLDDGLFSSVEDIAEKTDHPGKMFMLNKPLKTGSVFDSQYDQVMVNVMNKLLNSKKTGIKMEKVDRGFRDKYWSLEITDEIRDLILGQKHQLYK